MLEKRQIVPLKTVFYSHFTDTKGQWEKKELEQLKEKKLTSDTVKPDFDD